MRVFGEQLSASELRRRTGDLASVAGVREIVLDNGVERGVRVVQVRTTAGLEFELLVDRALDIGNARFKAIPFGWRSGNGYRHPGLHENHDEQGLGWLRSLDGFLVTAGLDHTLAGGTYDASNYAYPPKPIVTQGLHGRMTGIPARLLEAAEIWDGEQCTIRVRAEVIQATTFGEHLRLTRTVEVDFDGSEIRLHDVVENLGFDKTPHMFLYHFNFGWPYVKEGTELVAPIAGHLAQSDSVAAQGIGYRRAPPPQQGFIEQVTEHKLVADPKGIFRVALLNEAGALGIELCWGATSLPNFFEWQNLRAGQYTIGLEPSTNHLTGEGTAREAGKIAWLEHGDSREYSSTIRLLDGASEISEVRERIRATHGQPD